jgi:vacuolar-type H+-ATPase subunit I/STV1
MEYTVKFCKNCSKPIVLCGNEQVPEKEAVALATMLFDVDNYESADGGKFICDECDPPVDALQPNTPANTQPNTPANTQPNTPVEVVTTPVEVVNVPDTPINKDINRVIDALKELKDKAARTDALEKKVAELSQSLIDAGTVIKLLKKESQEVVDDAEALHKQVKQLTVERDELTKNNIRLLEVIKTCETETARLNKNVRDLEVAAKLVENKDTTVSNLCKTIEAQQKEIIELKFNHGKEFTGLKTKYDALIKAISALQ